MSDSIFGKLLQDVDSIATLLNKYFDVVYECDFGPKKRLTEKEELSREEIVADLNNLIHRFRNDAKAISNKVCNSKETQYEENRNLVDLINTLASVSARLKRFGKDDEEVEDLRKLLSDSISIFKENLITLNQKSIVKLYTWEEARRIGQKEMADLMESDELFNS